jgi:filamentous hemagglutinin family protein
MYQIRSIFEFLRFCKRRTAQDMRQGRDSRGYGRGWTFGYRSIRSLTGIVLGVNAIAIAPAASQIVPDNSLPTASVVRSSETGFQIEGGTVRGSNTFHSFDLLSLPTGNTLQFAPIAGTETILTRVTGGFASEIDGIISSTQPLDLILINPAGIRFGANARLDLEGSFLATTANQILFEDGLAFGLPVNTSPLLSLNAPIGLQLGREPGAIEVRSGAELAVNPGQQLGLWGGAIDLNDATLLAPRGQLRLVAAANPKGDARQEMNGTMPPIGDIPLNLSSIDLLTTLSSLSSQRQPITLQGNTRIDISHATADPGGSIALWGSDLDFSGQTQISANTFGAGSGGTIALDADRLNLDERASISSLTTGLGRGSDINLKVTETLRLRGDTRLDVTNQILGRTFNPQALSNGLYALTVGAGTTGNIAINTGSLLLDRGTGILATSFGLGDGGTITIDAADTVALTDGSLMLTGTLLTGQAGDLNLTANRLEITGGSSVATTTFGPGQGGNLRLNAREAIEAIGSPVNQLASTGGFSRLFLVLPTGIFSGSTGQGDAGTGNAGDVIIETPHFVLRDGALLTAASTSVGNGGNAIVQAETVEVVGVSSDGRLSSSLIASASGTRGNAGDVRLEVGTLSVRDGGTVTATTFFGSGSGGTLEVSARDLIEITGRRVGSLLPSGLTAGSGLLGSEFQATGSGGDVLLRSPIIRLEDGGEIGVSSVAFGDAGSVRIETDLLTLDRGSRLVGETQTGGGANLVLRADSIRLQNESQITTNAGNTDSGNITITTNTLVGLGNSDITANALAGRGGQVNIVTQGIFGIDFRSQLTPRSDITATSNLGVDFSGTVNIQTPDIKTDAALNILPSRVDSDSSIALTACANTSSGQFSLAGQDGLAYNPFEHLPPIDYSIHPIHSSPSATRNHPAQTHDAITTQSPDLPLPQEANRLDYSQDGVILLRSHPTNHAECQAVSWE